VSEITQILQAMQGARQKAADDLLPLVYGELRRLAAHKMAGEDPNQTLQPTALVHEVWLRLSGKKNAGWNDRTHFFAAAAEAMRLILVDSARRKHAQRHGGGQLRVELPDIAIDESPNNDRLLAVNEALDKFAAKDRHKAELVKLRYFVGMTIEEAAQVLEISVPAAKRHWAYARAWLAHEIANSR
jgi:RNA polymerase sigma factor (TIGR02999 family)